MFRFLTLLALGITRTVRHAVQSHSLLDHFVDCQANYTRPLLIIGTSNDRADLLDDHISEYEREGAVENWAPHIPLEIRSNNINCSQKLPKFETSVVGEPNFDSLAKISHFMQGECCIGVERRCFLQLRARQG